MWTQREIIHEYRGLVPLLNGCTKMSYKLCYYLRGEKLSNFQTKWRLQCRMREFKFHIIALHQVRLFGSNPSKNIISWWQSSRRSSKIWLRRAIVRANIITAQRKTNLMHNLFLVYFVNLYMFRAYLGPSSGGTTACIQQLVLIILFRWLSVVLFGMESNQDSRQSSKIISTNFCIHTVVSPDDGPRYARNV